jgi:(1->4)-alpha-D-glucan 1-alpha-D-glucosylmutase
LNFRRRHADLFKFGEYVPLEVTGPTADHVCAFARIHEGAMVVVVAPRLVLPLQSADRPIWHADAWKDTVLALPASAGEWQDLFTGARLPTSQTAVPLGSLLGDFPVAVLFARR